MSNQEIGTITVRRTVRPADFESFDVTAEWKYNIDLEDEEGSLAELNEAYLTVAKTVLDLVGVEYEIKNGRITELPGERATTQIKKTFGEKNVTDVTPASNVTPIKNSAASGSDEEVAIAYAREYKGDFKYLNDMKQKVLNGQSLSENMINGILKCKARDKTA